jgi:MarR family transcriptional regulator, organic hydroperoxide resistance regulator
MAIAPPRLTAAAEAWRLMQLLFFRGGKPRFFGIAQEFDLAPLQAKLLIALEPGVRMTMGEAALLMHCDNSNVTGVVDRLEARGVVARGSDPRDRRVKLIGLTEGGETLQVALKARLEEPPPGLAALPAADQRLLRDLLQRVIDAT